MSDGKEGFLNTLKKKQNARNEGTLIDPPDVRPYTPNDYKYFVIHLYGPEGPYMSSTKNSFIISGAFDNEKDAETHMHHVVNNVPYLNGCQSVVWYLGDALSMPLLPHAGIDRIFHKSQRDAAKAWRDMSRYNEQEANEVRANANIAKDQYNKGKEKELQISSIKMTEVDEN